MLHHNERIKNMPTQWKYFDFVIDLRNVSLTPLDDVIGSLSVKADALLSMNFPGRSKATFIYWMVGSPDSINRELERSEHIIHVDTSPFNNDNFGLHVHTEMTDEYLLNRLLEYPVILDTPIDFDPGHEATLRIITPKDVSKGIRQSFASRSGVDLEKAGFCRPTGEDPLDVLTDRQEEILRSAVQEGYYEIPREINHLELGDQLGISSTTVGEHLRKIESRLINQNGFGGADVSFTRCDRIPLDTGTGL